MIIENTKGISLSEIGIDVEQIEEATGISMGSEIFYPLENTDIIKKLLKDSIFDFLFEQIEYKTDVMKKINVDTDFNFDIYFCYEFSRLRVTTFDKAYVKIFIEFNNDDVKNLIRSSCWVDCFDMMCVDVTLEEADKDYLLKITADCLERCFCGEFINVVS